MIKKQKSWNKSEKRRKKRPEWRKRTRTTQSNEIHFRLIERLHRQPNSTPYEWTRRLSTHLNLIKPDISRHTSNRIVSLPTDDPDPAQSVPDRSSHFTRWRINAARSRNTSVRAQLDCKQERSIHLGYGIDLLSRAQMNGPIKTRACEWVCVCMCVHIITLQLQLQWFSRDAARLLL